MVYEKLKHIQPMTEGERKRLRDPKPAAPGESSPPAFKGGEHSKHRR